MRIALDAMGVITLPKNTVEGTVLALKEYAYIEKLFLVGDAVGIGNELKRFDFKDARIEIFHASEVVSMKESAAKAVRHKKDASICRAGSFGSVRQLVDAIMQYLAQHNFSPKRYVWRAKGEEILAKIQRAWKVALDTARWIRLGRPSPRLQTCNTSNETVPIHQMNGTRRCLTIF